MEDAEAMHQGIAESFAELRPWLPWAKTMPTLEDARQKNRDSLAKFVAGSAYSFRIYSKAGSEFLGVLGLEPQDPDVPSFELGYWLRTSFTGRGFTTEAISGLLSLAQGQLQARRIQVRVDERNSRSWRILQRLGFDWEGTMKNCARDNNGDLVNMRLFAKTATAPV
jgi:RimJ/RimL family protein N-acetyltransferase